MKFTYGFEIEGLFKKSLFEKLLKVKNITEINLKDDGSVNCYNSDYIYDVGNSLDNVSKKFKEKNISFNFYEDTKLKEITIGVFNNQNDLLEAINAFDNGTYYYDESCGLHLHIKPINLFVSTDIKSYLFVKKLAKLIKKEFCECCQTRIAKNKYCRPYSTLKKTTNDFRREEKYKMMRIHPSGTFEFRFLTPCEHKISNIKKLLQFIKEIIPALENLESNITLEEEKLNIINNLELGRLAPHNKTIKICV